MTAVQRTRSRTPTVVGIVLIVTGVVVGAVSVVLFVLPFYDTLTQPTLSVPGVHAVDLDTGTYNVYARVDTDVGDPTGLGTPGRASTGSSSITVTGPDDTAVIVRGPGSVSEEMQRDSGTYVNVARIDVRHAGEHEVRISDVAPSSIIIAKSLGTTFREAARWLLIGLLAGIAVVVGIVVLLVGWWNRRREARAAAQYAGASGQWTPYGHTQAGQHAPSKQHAQRGAGQAAPPGWYPDPHRAGALRYWNGHAWTSDTHDPGTTR